MSDSATVSSSGTSPGSLVGSDFAAVCERYGAPLGCHYEDGTLRLAYRMRFGGVMEGAIEMVDGVVVTETPWIRRSDRKCCRQEMVGQPVEQVLPPLGKPRRSEVMGESTRLVYADCVVTVHEGTVNLELGKRNTL